MLSAIMKMRVNKMQDWLLQCNVIGLGIAIRIGAKSWRSSFSIKSYYSAFILYWRQSHIHLLVALLRDCPTSKWEKYNWMWISMYQHHQPNPHWYNLATIIIRRRIGHWAYGSNKLYVKKGFFYNTPMT